MEVTTTEARRMLAMNGGGGPAITVWDARKLQAAKKSPGGTVVAGVVDTLGKRSAVAQGLPKTITTSSLLVGSNHTLFVLAQDGLAVGILKTGEKNLFIRRSSGALVEMQPNCVLDFYVSETHQRTGLGKLLFEFMLSHTATPAHRFAYDRPSPLLLSFLKKHYALADYVSQNNNYVVYNKYWTAGAAAATPREDRRASDDASRFEVTGLDPGAVATVRGAAPHRSGGGRPSCGALPTATPTMGRFASPQKRTSYNIITQQDAYGAPAETPVRTGKRLVRPL
eukprot:TRINITY_DN24635_c0_g1_i1.p1 TRINITY_DN24635_c0_g1~~TRINITY_DN24635_c0_g1_i1.p1  ORF type:complete len:304 (+),score=112.29 TRINITY_DN24635_c0_g1_i1:67-912(+)